MNDMIYFQIWEYFLAYSTIASRQGTATCYQITLVKNINSTHRIDGVPSQFGLEGALAASKVRLAGQYAKSAVKGVEAKIEKVIGAH